MKKGLTLDQVIIKLEALKKEGLDGKELVVFEDSSENTAFVTGVTVGTDGSNAYVGLLWNFE